LIELIADELRVLGQPLLDDVLDRVGDALLALVHGHRLQVLPKRMELTRYPLLI